MICDGIVCTLSPGDTIISNGTDEYLLTVTAGEPSTMTDGEDSLTWFFHHDPAKVIVVGSSDTSISETAPVLVACYDNNDKMLSVQFITASTGSADVTVGSKTVKLFWINTTGFTPRCARSPAVPLAPVSVGGGGGGSAPAP